jgi:predicted acylesterase/phospholipase RssA
MPVFLPPVIHGSEVLLDGALINNLRTDEMSKLEVGTVIAVDLWRPRLKGAPTDHIPAGWRLLSNLFSRARCSRAGVPYLLDVLYNAPTLSSAVRQVECARSVDVLIRPHSETWARSSGVLSIARSRRATLPRDPSSNRSNRRFC